MFLLQKIVYILPTRQLGMFHRDLLETGMSYSTQKHTTDSYFRDMILKKWP